MALAPPKRPHKLRFALGAVIAAAVLAITAVLDRLRTHVCEPVVACNEVQTEVYAVSLTIAALAGLHSVYRFYRDFIKDEYEHRCMRRGH